MIIEQFHREFKLTADKVDSLAYAEFEPWEIDSMLNKAQDMLIKQRYGGNNLYKSGFEQSQKRTDDLNSITTTKFAKVIPVTELDFYGDKIYQAKLDQFYNDENWSSLYDGEYMFYLRSRAKIKKGSCTSWKSVNLVKQDDIETIYVDPFNRPSPENPVIYFEDNSIFIISGTGAVDSFTVSFIKRPAQMNIGNYVGEKTECELSEHFHREIVERAVSIALEGIGSERTQSHAVINESKIE